MRFNIRGLRLHRKVRVLVDGIDLSPFASQKVMNHSPTGFDWNYRGSGPAQLALALLLHAGVPRDTAIERHQQLKEEVIASLGDGDFDINLDITPEGQWTRS